MYIVHCNKLCGQWFDMQCITYPLNSVLTKHANYNKYVMHACNAHVLCMNVENTWMLKMLESLETILTNKFNCYFTAALLFCSCFCELTIFWCKFCSRNKHFTMCCCKLLYAMIVIQCSSETLWILDCITLARKLIHAVLCRYIHLVCYIIFGNLSRNENQE